MEDRGVVGGKPLFGSLVGLFGGLLALLGAMLRHDALSCVYFFNFVTIFN